MEEVCKSIQDPGPRECHTQSSSTGKIVQMNGYYTISTSFKLKGYLLCLKKRNKKCDITKKIVFFLYFRKTCPIIIISSMNEARSASHQVALLKIIATKISFLLHFKKPFHSPSIIMGVYVVLGNQMNKLF